MRGMFILNHASVALGLAAALSACGNTAFTVGQSTSALQVAGQFEIPAKVDILLAQDNTGAMGEALSQVSTQVPAFLDDLEAAGWDYHFAVTPLTGIRPMNQLQILPSKHDGNWNAYGLFVPPYPGALYNSPGMSVGSTYFRTQSTFNQFVTSGEIRYDLGALEPTFETVKQFLNHPTAVSSGFLRPDALLAVIVLSNGNDTSGVTFTTRTDGFVVPDATSEANSFTNYVNDYNALITGNKTQDIRFFAAVANLRMNVCLGGLSTNGYRYRQMAGQFGGASVDICTNSIAQVLSGIGQNLTSTRINQRQRFLVIDQVPKVDTIVVRKYPGGNASQAITLPQSAVDGWTYVGQNTDYLIDYPMPLNYTSGIMIELHGSAKLWGLDSADVTFTPEAGAPSF